MKLRNCIAVAISGMLVLMAAPTPAFADTTPTQEAFRASLTAYVANLRAALGATAQNPQTKASIAPKLADDMTALTVADQQIALLTGDELDAMQGILGQNVSWQQQPAIVQHDLSQMPAAGPTASPPAGFLSDCSTDLGDPRGLFYGYWAAAQVASAANAVASGMPDGADFVAADIIAGAVFGVANGIAIALNANLTLSQDCATAVSNAALAATYPTDDGTGTGKLTAASSQISVNTLKTLSQGVAKTLDDIQTTTNAVTTTLSDVINSLGTAQGVANTILVTATDLQNRTDALLTSVGTASDQAADPGGAPASGSANGLANTINTREDTALSNTTNFQTLSVRAEIERSLASSSGPAVALFALPASQGGYLETVKSVVTTTIANELGAGQSIGQAQSNLTAGNNALAAGKYQAAYLDYAASYIQAVG